MVVHRLTRDWGWLIAAIWGLAIAGCQTQAYCFSDCEQASGEGGGIGWGSGQGGSSCVPSGEEVCDGKDNDCNAVVDDIGASNFEKPQSCGTCATNCYQTLLNCKVAAVGCVPSVNPGAMPGVCTCSECAIDYYDLDGDQSCEYFCGRIANDDKLCNNKDDDCDGTKDEDVDFCSDAQNCGKCGRTCAVVHGTGACVQTDGNTTCSEANTQCEIANCDCNAPNDCWLDLDQDVATGCEYLCSVTNGGVEVCDGLDNDCDGKVDDADDLSSDPSVGAVCYGDPDGLCATAEHAGVTVCQAGKVVCSGGLLLVENQQNETCNGVDDDCDGTVDDGPTDAGTACGVSSNLPCKLGKNQCQNGQLVCVGAVLPSVEACNGVDDDCDGTIDKTGNMPTADSVGPCNVPPPAPVGATQPCKAGSKVCQGGQVICTGFIGPTSPVDQCGDDSNCDGTLTNQPDFTSDVNHCGNCATDCQATAPHAIVKCTVGVCEPIGCEKGYYDLDDNGTCEYACTFISQQEACNGVDDNCNGVIDEAALAPSPVQTCGVSPSAVRPECTSQIQLSCVNGDWTCTFPIGVCAGGCSPNDEICDGLDNDCDGYLNENVQNFGAPCASDDSAPVPGHGACRTTGSYVCSSPSSTTCNAVKADCSTLPGGCTEACDGVDNDCDGLVDEAFTNKGSNSTNFVKPVVTKVGASLWTYTYEASRPSATSTMPGAGNGYWTSAPAGQTLDKTPACAVANKIPWFGVSPTEVEQVCTAMGGSICSLAHYQAACNNNTTCNYGYNPRGTACQAGYTSTKYCNLAPSFDFDSTTAGDQDGLLPTGSTLLQNCWSDWSGLQGNTTATDKLFDLTGNLREIVKDGAIYRTMGGAFNTQAESGAACNFTFYTVASDFKFYDTGFRCCFTSNPTL